MFSRFEKQLAQLDAVKSQIEGLKQDRMEHLAEIDICNAKIYAVDRRLAYYTEIYEELKVIVEQERPKWDIGQ